MGHVMGTRGSFSVSRVGQTALGMKLTTHLHLVSTLRRLHEAILPISLLPIVACTLGSFAIVDMLVDEISIDVLTFIVLSTITRSDYSFFHSLLVTFFVKLMVGKGISVHSTIIDLYTEVLISP